MLIHSYPLNLRLIATLNYGIISHLKLTKQADVPEAAEASLQSAIPENYVSEESKDPRGQPDLEVDKTREEPKPVINSNGRKGSPFDSFKILSGYPEIL